MKKFLAITLALVMTFAMVACGGTSSSTPASTPASGTGAAEPAAEGGEIVIGCLQDITGATSALGMSVQAGAQAAVDEINAAGGIGGKTVVMKTYDTKGDVTEAVNAYITAVTVDNVSLIVGPPVANIANAIKETSEDYDVPVMVFRSFFMASFAVKNDLKTFGIIYNQENSYSVSLLDPFIEQLAADGITVDDSLVVAYGAADTDYKTLLQPIVSAGVDAIYCPNYTQQLVAIVTAATELGYEGKIVCGLDAAPSFNTTYGGDCSNIYYINNINTDDPTTAEMAAAVEDKVSAVNKYFLGYDVVMIAKQCIEEAGLDDAAALLSAIENVKDFKGLTGTVTIDPETHMPDGMGMFMYTYDNQTPVMLEEFAG